eukprot:1504727-Prymnesium_polylepis.1
MRASARALSTKETPPRHISTIAPLSASAFSNSDAPSRGSATTSGPLTPPSMSASSVPKVDPVPRNSIGGGADTGASAAGCAAASSALASGVVPTGTAPPDASAAPASDGPSVVSMPLAASRRRSAAAARSAREVAALGAGAMLTWMCGSIFTSGSSATAVSSAGLVCGSASSSSSAVGTICCSTCVASPSSPASAASALTSAGATEPMPKPPGGAALPPTGRRVPPQKRQAPSLAVSGSMTPQSSQRKTV